MTELTTIIVATPSITLITLASAMYRVRRYRQQSRYLYTTATPSVGWVGGLRRDVSRGTGFLSCHFSSTRIAFVLPRAGGINSSQARSASEGSAFGIGNHAAASRVSISLACASGSYGESLFCAS